MEEYVSKVLEYKNGADDIKTNSIQVLNSMLYYTELLQRSTKQLSEMISHVEPSLPDIVNPGDIDISEMSGEDVDDIFSHWRVYLDYYRDVELIKKILQKVGSVGDAGTKAIKVGLKMLGQGGKYDE